LEYVSLLPPEIKTKKKTQDRQRKLIIAFFLLILVLILINVYYLVSIVLDRQELRTLQDEREMIERQSAALEEYEILFQKLIAREKLIVDAMGTTPLWGELLSNASRSLTVGTWLSDLNLSYSDNSGSLSMSGWAYDYTGVADMLDRLFKDDQFEQIKSRVSAETDYRGYEVVRFQVDGVIPAGPRFFSDDQGGE